MRTLLVGIAIASLAVAAAPRDADANRRHHRHHHHHGWGPRVSVGVWPAYSGWGYGWPAYGWRAYPWRSGAWIGAPLGPYPIYARPYPYWDLPARVIVEEPPVYVGRDDAPAARSWYYCRSRRGYYPNVDSCPEPWIPVPPRD